MTATIEHLIKLILSSTQRKDPSHDIDGSFLCVLKMAGVQGFETQLADPESAVLPLNDTPMS